MDGLFSDEMRANALNATPCEILTLNAETHCVLGANDRLLSNLEVPFSAIRDQPVEHLFCEATRDAVASGLDALVSGDGTPAHCLARHQRQDGSTYEVELDLRFADASRTTILATALDVTGQQAAERRATEARNNLQAAIEALPHGFVLFDEQDRLVICNEPYREIYPNSAPSMVPGATFEEILRYGLERGEYADGIGREDAWLEERLTKHQAADETVLQQLSDGRTLQIIERPTLNGGRVGLRIDITPYVTSRERAERAEQRLLDAISALPAGFWLFDRDDRLVMLNDRFKDMYNTSADWLEPGYTYKEILQHGLERGQYPEAEGRKEAWLSEVLERRNKETYELVYRLDDGRWVHSLNETTSEGGMVGFRVDITELKRRQVEAEKAAETDPLTGLLNRRGVTDFLERVSQTVTSGEELIFLHIDLDKFKSVNDVHGHAAGDDLLSHVAGILQHSTRADGRIARVGGDEFLVCFKALKGDQDSPELAEQMRELISKPVRINGKTCHVGASIGLASWQPDGPYSLSDAMQNADIALNSSKSHGRNRVTHFEQSMRDRSVRTAEVAERVANGLDRGEFIAFFQPQLDCRTLKPTGFECLVRWNHPQDGICEPGDFLPACEAAGLTSAIDRVVFDEALNFATQLGEMGWENLRLGINISSAQLKDPEIVDQYLWRIASHGLSPDRFCIEVLESTLLDQRVSHIIDNIHRFSEHGFLIELDDFGTGHTAIASLREYPVNRIKIDRSLITGVDREPDLEKLTSAVVALGRGLGIEVLAEGVERAGEYETVLRMGCTGVQGFLLGEPMRRQECLEWLTRDTSPFLRRRA